MSPPKNYVRLCFIALILVSGRAWSDNISNVKVSVNRPAHLSLGEQVKVTFNYTTNHSGSVRIFVRPMTGNTQSPNYSAHGSQVYSARRGRGRGSFTISSGNVTVDKIRINIIAANGQELFSKLVPTRLQFSKTPVKTMPILQVLGMQNYQVMGTTESPAVTETSGDAGVTRTILPNGDVEIRYPDGRRKILYAGGYKIIFPDGREQIASYMSVQVATPPTLPAEQSIVDWLEMINGKLLNTIGVLVDGDQNAVNYYVQKENSTTGNLYEKMQLRTAYIDRLLIN